MQQLFAGIFKSEEMHIICIEEIEWKNQRYLGSTLTKQRKLSIHLKLLSKIVAIKVCRKMSSTLHVEMKHLHFRVNNIHVRTVIVSRVVMIVPTSSLSTCRWHNRSSPYINSESVARTE